MTTGTILKTVRQSRLDSQNDVGKITGYSRQHIAACEKDLKCFSQYPSIVNYVLTVITQNIEVEETLRRWLTETTASEQQLKEEVRKLARCIVDRTL